MPNFNKPITWLDDLPVILAGPILRRVVPDEVNVWVALKKQSSNIVLNVRDADSLTATVVCTGKGETLSLGKNLHLACISAKPVNSQQKLADRRIYFYDLWIDGKDFTQNGILLKNSFDFRSNFCLGNYKLPSFCLPPGQVFNPQLVHGSCRKIHSLSIDGFIKLDYLLDYYCDKPIQRPQLLCLTGDQIYADDVDKTLLLFLIDACNELLPDWKEKLPGEVASAPVANQFLADNLVPGQRHQVVKSIGFTGGDKTSTNHLLLLGEFCMMYLFAWSPTLWPPDSAHLSNFRTLLISARKVLANVPTYMCFDDHEITDDWFFNYAWCERTLASTNLTARRVISNGMAAFALFQMWGNQGSQFFQSSSFFSPLKSYFSANAAPNWGALESKLLPQLQSDSQGGYWLQYATSAKSPWCFQVDFQDFRIFFLDTRTQRGFASKTAPPALIHPTKIPAQLSATGSKPITFVVSPAPVFETEFKEAVQKLVSQGWWSKTAYVLAPKISLLFNLMVVDPLEYDYETWKGSPKAFSQLLLSLAAFQRVVILSGDVHYGFSLQISFWNEKTNAKATFVQLCSSALKNSMSDDRKSSMVSSLYKVFDSGADTVVVAAKTTTAGEVFLGSDFEANEISWQYLQKPASDHRTAKTRGLLNPAPAGRKGVHYLSAVQKEQVGWDSAKYIVLENNCATVKFGTDTLTHALQYQPNFNQVTVQDLTFHTLSHALPDDNTKPIK